MQQWRRVAIVFCGFALVCNFVPSEPFLTPYLLNVKGFTEDEVNNQIYTVWSYAFTVFLLIVGPAAETVGYKTLVVTNALAHMVTRVVLVWGETLGAMQFMQVTYALAMACEVVYFCYVYKLVDAAHYQRLTSLTRSATLLSRVFSGVLAQLLVLYADVPLVTLFYISFVSSCIALVQSLWFPGTTIVDTFKAYYWPQAGEAPKSTTGGRMHAFFVHGIAFCKRIYSDRLLLVMSLLLCLVQCGILAIEGYASSLWYFVDPSVEFNGFVDSAARLCGAIGAFLPTVIYLSKHRVLPSALIVLGCLLSAILVVIMTLTPDLWVCYVCYIGFEGSIYFSLAIVSVQIASRVEDNRFAAVFALNSLASAIVFTIVQLIVSSLSMETDARFDVYSVYFGLVVLAAVVSAVSMYFSGGQGQPYHEIPSEVDNHVATDMQPAASLVNEDSSAVNM